MNDNELIAHRLKVARERAKLKQIGGGAYGKVAQSTIATWETGKPSSALITLKKLALRYNTSADYLLGLTDDHRPIPSDALPEGAQKLISYFDEMSERGQHDLLAIAERLHESDKEWQATDNIANMLNSFYGEEFMDAAEKQLEILTSTLGGGSATRDSFSAWLTEYFSDK